MCCSLQNDEVLESPEILYLIANQRAWKICRTTNLITLRLSSISLHHIFIIL